MRLRLPKLPRLARRSRRPKEAPAEASPDVEEARRHVPSVPPVVVPRWIQLVVLPLALLGAWALARAAGPVFLILVVAGVIALVLNPLVKLVESIRFPRPLAIVVVYVGGFAALGGVGVLIANPLSTQVGHFQRDVPRIVNQANKTLADFQSWLNRQGIHVQIQKQGQTALQTLGKNISKRSGDIVSFSRDLLTKVVTASFAFVLVLVLSIYLLIYGKQIGGLVRRIIPPGDGTPEDDYPLLVQRAVTGYVRGQLLFSLIMGASAAISLWIFGLLGIFSDGGRYALFFGGFYGLMELVPYVGPFIGGLPAVVVAVVHSPITAVWVTLLFVALQQFEGHVVAPQVFGHSLRINPILIILSLLIGGEIYGIAGALVALPVAAILRETVVYLRKHLVLEAWTPAAPGVGVLPTTGFSGGARPDRCPDCGAAAGREDVFCRRCGASLEPRVRAPG